MKRGERMPRKRIIDQDDIKIEYLIQEKYLDVIQKKDCLGITLALNHPFKYNVKFMNPNDTITINPNNIITRPINNSWKGLVMFFLALAYLNLGKDFYMEYAKSMSYSYKIKNGKKVGKKRQNFNLRIELSYVELMDVDKRNEYIMEAMSKSGRISDVIELFQKDSEASKQQLKDKRNAYLKEKFKTLPPDDKIEEISVAAAPVPVELQKIYVSGIWPQMGIYEPLNIQSYLQFFVDILDIDLKLSTIRTQDSPQLPHIYKKFPAKPVWT